MAPLMILTGTACGYNVVTGGTIKQPRIMQKRERIAGRVSSEEVKP